MADEEIEEGAPEGEGADAGGKKKKLIIIGAAALVVILAGAGGAMFMMGGSEEPAPVASEEEEDGESDEEASEEKGDKAASEDGKEGKKDGEEKDEEDDEADAASQIKFGETYTLKTFNLNLGNPLENHFVRFDVALEYGGGENQKAEIEKRLPQLRDAIVSVASRKSREFLLGPDGKDQLRREILIRINRYMSQPIEAVYITDILIE